jgi:hypothetical protein
MLVLVDPLVAVAVAVADPVRLPLGQRTSTR